MLPPSTAQASEALDELSHGDGLPARLALRADERGDQVAQDLWRIPDGGRRIRRVPCAVRLGAPKALALVGEACVEGCVRVEHRELAEQFAGVINIVKILGLVCEQACYAGPKDSQPCPAFYNRVSIWRCSQPATARKIG
jgi:hypothetical protein